MTATEQEIYQEAAAAAVGIGKAGIGSTTGTRSRRLFLGNLHPDIKPEDLAQRFGNFGTVHGVDVKSKNDATFAFLDISFNDSENGLRKCIDLLNNTKWKGLMLKVQLAKENFIEKLKKERELSRNLRRPRPPDNFEFEIVSSTAAAPGADAKGGRPPQINGKSPVKPSQSQSQSVAIATKSSSPIPIKQKLESSPPAAKKTEPANVSSSSDSDSDSDYDSDPDEPAKKSKANQLPMFKGILSYPGLQPKAEPLPVPIVSPSSQVISTPITTKPPEIPSSSVSTGFQINPLKKQKSDALRVQSLQTRDQLKKSREAIVRQALSNTNLVEQQKNEAARAQTPASASKSKAASKNFLFGKDASEEEDDDDANLFKIKPQYEGEAGQRLMELSSKFGGDERFKLDERFGEERETMLRADDGLDVASEKQSQMDVLSEMFGPGIMTSAQKKGNFGGSSGSVQQNKKALPEPVALGLVRYHPSSAEHKMRYEVKVETEKPEPQKHKQSEPAQSDSSPPKPKRGRKAEEDSTEIQVAPAQPAVPVEMPKPVYQVASNLKQLFNDGETAAVTPKFSLLSSFGGSGPAGENNEEEETNNTPTGVFWNTAKANPFKYDSSDDENEGENKKKSKNQRTERPEERDLTNHLNLFKGESFFYTEGDPRLAGVLKSFMQTDEDLDLVRTQFNDGGRSELKVIAKAKWRNSKRKNDKRIRAIKLVRKKKRRDAVKKLEHTQKIRAIREARAGQD